MGTYNANPLAAVAGAACLRKCADQSVHDRCDEMAATLRSGMNAAIVKHDVPAFVWGESSVFHIAMGDRIPNQTGEDIRTPEGVSTEYLKNSGSAKLAVMAELGMMLEGVHLFHSGGFTCTAHTDADIEHTVSAFDRTIGRMKNEGAFTS